MFVTDATEDHVHQCTEPEPKPFTDGEQWEIGWYFSDETDQLNGPYATRGEAVNNLHEYCQRYL